MTRLNDVITGAGRQSGNDMLVRGRIKCADGATLSVQASWGHYCTPRDSIGPYTHVEVGFPSVSPPDTWAQYFEGNWEHDDHTESVYGYVPVELVKGFIEAHGGEVV